MTAPQAPDHVLPPVGFTATSGWTLYNAGQADAQWSRYVEPDDIDAFVAQQEADGDPVDPRTLAFEPGVRFVQLAEVS